MAYLIAQNDDPLLLEWLAKANNLGGGFIRQLAGAALCADHENYPVLRPVLLEMRKKYTEYEPTEAVRNELKR